MSLFAEDALLPDGWAHDVLIEWDASGRIVDVQADVAQPAGLERAKGPVMAGIGNAHTHAFQHAFAGLTEYRAQDHDSFWTWRDIMYRFAAHVDADELEWIATHLFIQLLRGGYTSVCEFHYLHNDRDGRAYVDDATLALALVSAARRVGIGLTLLPALYETNGFGVRSPRREQRRFIRSVDSILGLVERLRRQCSGDSVRIGLALHSLRAVAPASIDASLMGLRSIDADAPVHIHIAEQEREVEECLAWSGQRPVEWLLDHVDLDRRWCLVHATHMTAQEARGAASRGVVAALCPSTEANLGDGVFDASGWWSAGGDIALGSDSNICTDAFAEGMMLEYSQRLAQKRRNVLADEWSPHVATALMQRAVSGGARAAGRPVAGIAPGQMADLVVLASDDAMLADLPARDQLSTCVFAQPRRKVASVCVGGRWRIVDGNHPAEAAAAGAYQRTRRNLARLA